MNNYENPEREQSPTETMTALLKTMVEEGNFYIEDGESREEVIDRCELLERVLGKLDQIAPQVIETYRNILEENGVTREQTGKISWVVVGGRVHGESQLKVNSDIDTLFTAEKPFYDMKRRVYLTEGELALLPEEIDVSIRKAIRQGLAAAFESEILHRLSEMIGRDLGKEKYSVFEVKGYGEQRNQDVKNGLVIITEQ